MQITEISDDAWASIINIQDEAYSGVLPERLNVLKSKWVTSPETCFIFKTESNVIKGYLLAHVWDSYNPPKLFEELPTITNGSILYLHDLAVSQDAKGIGVGKQLVQKLMETAKTRQYKEILLVAVQGAESFWSRFGFNEMLDSPVCSSYGSDARLMHCLL